MNSDGRYPAFPRGVYAEDGGITVRDYFPAAALHGMLACPNYEGGKSDDTIARDAYFYADQILRVRAKGVSQ